MIKSHPGSLFTYFFAHCWVDFRGRGLDNPPEGPIGYPLEEKVAVDWEENTRKAMLANWLYCVDNPDGFSGYGPESWGLTACEGPVPPVAVGGTGTSIYKAYGALPNGEGAAISDGTIAPYGAGCSINHLPTQSIAALRNYYRSGYFSQLFGFVDAFNLGGGPISRRPDFGAPFRSRTREPRPSDDEPRIDRGWRRVNHSYFGIDQGPLLIMLENFRSGLVWEMFRQNPHVNEALKKVYGS